MHLIKSCSKKQCGQSCCNFTTNLQQNQRFLRICTLITYPVTIIKRMLYRQVRTPTKKSHLLKIGTIHFTSPPCISEPQYNESPHIAGSLGGVSISLLNRINCLWAEVRTQGHMHCPDLYSAGCMLYCLAGSGSCWR